MSVLMLFYGVACMSATFLMSNSVRNAKWSVIGHIWVVAGILYWLIADKEKRVN